MVDVIPAEQTEVSISTSRTFQEMLKIEHGDSSYRRIAALLDTSMPYIDKLAEDLGMYLASRAVREKYDAQYFDPKYGKFKNFITRNICLNSEKKRQMEEDRFFIGAVTAGTVETGVKLAARGAQALAVRSDRIMTLGEVYALLYSFAYYIDDFSDNRRAVIELNKIRNSLPLNASEQHSVLKKYGKTPLDIMDLPTISALSGEGSSELRENISYMLYAIYCQKYGDDERGMDTLLDYYIFLGYHGNYAKELIRENNETYGKITDDQLAYLKISRSMIRNMLITVPEINVERLKSQADAMAKYDPYSIRRKKTQNAAGGAITSLAGIFSKRPDWVIQGGATALSQLTLENNDNAVEFIQKQFQNNGVDINAFNHILNQSKEMNSKAINDFAENKDFEVN